MQLETKLTQPNPTMATGDCRDDSVQVHVYDVSILSNPSAAADVQDAQD